MSKYEREKGNRIEREIVELHKGIGIFAERVPLSGASGYRDEGHDVNIYPFGRSAKPLVLEVKARKEGAGFTLLKRWLADYDGLVTREDRQQPLVTVPWHVWAALLAAVRSTNIQPEPKSEPADVT